MSPKKVQITSMVKGNDTCTATCAPSVKGMTYTAEQIKLLCAMCVPTLGQPTLRKPAEKSRLGKPDVDPRRTPTPKGDGKAGGKTGGEEEEPEEAGPGKGGKGGANEETDNDS